MLLARLRASNAARAALGVCGVGAYTGHQYLEFEAKREDELCCEHLPGTEEAQASFVVRLPRFLSPTEIDAVHRLHQVCFVLPCARVK